MGKSWVLGLILGMFMVMGSNGDPQVPWYFVFGDSLVDNGSKNTLSSLARSNYFPQGPTGRFSNGRTTVDVILELLGFDDYVPSYATAGGDAILRGVNYSSAAAGIRDETGQQGAMISLGGHIQNYQHTVIQLVNILRDEDRPTNYLSKCIYSIGLGSNDYLNNYFMPNYYSTSTQFSPQEYADVLIQEYAQQLSSLYNYGARKVATIDIEQIGCSPNELAQRSPDWTTCVEAINVACQLFNDHLKPFVNQFNANFPDARFIYVDAYGIFQNLINWPASFRFSITNAWLPWDAFHPSDAANVVERRSYAMEAPTDAYTIDIRHLVLL